MSSLQNNEKPITVIFYTDPLCCWSYGMEKQWLQLQNEYSNVMQWRYCMGGLLPDWNHYHDEVNSVTRPVQMGPVWMEAAHITGTDIRSTIWMKDPPASSYLSCIAVKAMAMQSPQAEEIYLHALRKAVMTQELNIAFEKVLNQIAEQTAKDFPGIIDATRFAADLRSDTARQAFRNDLDEVQRHHITRFPTIIVKAKDQQPLIVTGYRPYEVLKNMVERLLPATI